MTDPGPADVLTKVLSKEMPKAAAMPTAPKEKTSVPKQDTQPSGQAHKTLEQIAAGKPLAEVFAPPTESAPLPDRETVSGLLTEANSILLDAKDARILVSALATQAKDTPLGNEMRIDALRMISTMSNEHLPPEAVIQLDQLQKKVTALNLPESTPEQSQLYQTIQKYNEAHPEKPIPAVADAPGMVKILQSNTEFATEIWNQLGLDNFSGWTNPEAKQILALTEIDQTPENLKKMNEIFGAIKAAKTPVDLLGKVVPGLIIGAMGIMFVSQIAGVDQGAH